MAYFGAYQKLSIFLFLTEVYKKFSRFSHHVKARKTYIHTYVHAPIFLRKTAFTIDFNVK